jgi:ABC-type transport system involved in Fe-S cluster assembly fused permease/ATPase subunit
MWLTLAAYSYVTRQVSEKRRVFIRERKDAEKSSEFYLNESIMNYETVKAFGNEPLELKRYTKLVQKLKEINMKV